MGTQLPVAVIICTKDRPTMLERCLVSLLHGTAQPAAIMVID
jgi:hypothetical protein